MTILQVDLLALKATSWFAFPATPTEYSWKHKKWCQVPTTLETRISNNRLPDTGKNFSNHNTDGAGLTNYYGWHRLWNCRNRIAGPGGTRLGCPTVQLGSRGFAWTFCTDDVKVRYKNAHLKKLRAVYNNMTYSQCCAAYCFILSNIYKYRRYICSM